MESVLTITSIATFAASLAPILIKFIWGYLNERANRKMQIRVGDSLIKIDLDKLDPKDIAKILASVSSDDKKSGAPSPPAKR
jgi:hypothetical protein